MERTVSTEKELSEALRDGVDTIEIEADLKKKVVRIKATGQVAWAIALGVIAVTVILALASIPSGGTSEIPGLITTTVAASILGIPAAISAVLIAVAGGGVSVLNKLRSYDIVKNTNEQLILVKK